MISQSVAPVTTRAEQRIATRQRLLDRAAAIVAAEGVERLTSRRVAGAAGVAAGTFFVHFPTVADLLAALLDRPIGTALDRGIASAAADATPTERLLHVAGVLFDTYEANAEVSRALIQANLFTTPTDDPFAARYRQFEAWALDQLGGGTATAEHRARFAGFFATYFGVLVAGLRGDMSRDEQLGHLRVVLEADR